MTHWGPNYDELEGYKHHKETPEEIEKRLASARRHEAFPNVSYTDPDGDHVKTEWALRRKKDNKIVVVLDGQNEPYEFGPMGHCPEGYEVVTRVWWPEQWKRPGW